MINLGVSLLKTIMIVGAGKAQVPLIESAKKEGYHTVVCDINPDAPGVELAHEYCRVSTKDRNGLLRTAQEKKINGIVANSEYAMCDVAFISQKLGLVGNPEEAIAILSSKSKFRTLQKQIGLFAPKVEKELSFPVIIKPDMSSGTRGTTAVYDELEIKEAVETCSNLSRNGKAIVEEYIPIDPETVIEGEIFIYDGQILWDGLFRSIRSKVAPMIPMTYVFPLAEERVEKLKKSLEEAFCAAGVINGEYNIEACFVNEEPFIIEINPRQGGNDLPKYVQEHCGIDYYKLLITTSMRNERYWNSLKTRKKKARYIIHHMLFPRRNGQFKGLEIAEPIKEYIQNVQLDEQVGNTVMNAVDADMSIGFVDLEFFDTEEQRMMSFKMEELIKVIVE